MARKVTTAYLAVHGDTWITLTGRAHKGSGLEISIYKGDPPTGSSEKPIGTLYVGKAGIGWRPKKGQVIGCDWEDLGARLRP